MYRMWRVAAVVLYVSVFLLNARAQEWQYPVPNYEVGPFRKNENPSLRRMITASPSCGWTMVDLGKRRNRNGKNVPTVRWTASSQNLKCRLEIAAYQRSEFSGGPMDSVGLQFDEGLLALKGSPNVPRSGFATPRAAAVEHFNRAAALDNAGELSQAVEEYRTAIAFDPALVDAYYDLGRALLAQSTLVPSGKVQPLPGTSVAFQTYLAVAQGGPKEKDARSILSNLGEPISSPESDAQAQRVIVQRQIDSELAAELAAYNAAQARSQRPAEEASNDQTSPPQVSQSSQNSTSGFTDITGQWSCSNQNNLGSTYTATINFNRDGTMRQLTPIDGPEWAWDNNTYQVEGYSVSWLTGAGPGFRGTINSDYSEITGRAYGNEHAGTGWDGAHDAGSFRCVHEASKGGLSGIQASSPTAAPAPDLHGGQRYPSRTQSNVQASGGVTDAVRCIKPKQTDKGLVFANVCSQEVNFDVCALGQNNGCTCNEASIAPGGSNWALFGRPSGKVVWTAAIGGLPPNPAPGCTHGRAY